MRNSLPDIEKLLQGIRSGNRTLLGQAITLVESARAEHQALAHTLIQRLLSGTQAGRDTLRIGITGAPGAGKSTFIETLGIQLTEAGQKVAVLAIDPSSTISKGSIMGDKTRMERLSTSEMAFIRPSPSGESLGGVARKTRETIFLVEAAGYDTVIIETVGVGQSETAVHSMTDVFLLLLLPGAGDELQGIKRGIVEMADILAVNKADGERVKLANQARAYYLNATHLLPAGPSDWTPRVLVCSALEGSGVPAVWQSILDFKNHTQSNGFFAENRRRQAAYWFKEALQDGLMNSFYHDPEVSVALKRLEPEVLAARISPFAAAAAILGDWLSGKHS